MTLVLEVRRAESRKNTIKLFWIGKYFVIWLKEKLLKTFLLVFRNSFGPSWKIEKKLPYMNKNNLKLIRNNIDHFRRLQDSKLLLSVFKHTRNTKFFKRNKHNLQWQIFLFCNGLVDNITSTWVFSLQKILGPIHTVLKFGTQLKIAHIHSKGGKLQACVPTVT